MRFFRFTSRKLIGACYPSAEVQSVYSTALANWAIHRVNVKTVILKKIQFSISTHFGCQNSERRAKVTCV